MKLYFKIIVLILIPMYVYGKKYTHSIANLNLPLKHKAFKSINVDIPKSGTHLLTKCIRYLQNQPVKDAVNPSPEDIPKKCELVTPQSFLDDQNTRFIQHVAQKYGLEGRNFAFHLIHTKEHEEFVLNSTDSAFFLLRDPRDQLVSFVNWVCPTSEKNTDTFGNMLFDFIEGSKKRDTHVVRMLTFSILLWSLGIAESYKLYLPWMKTKNVRVVRFENLVGSKGGGSDQLQEQEIRNIACHLKIELSAKRLSYIKKHLFGGTNTFNKGQIGSWKRYFNAEHKAAFKRVAGQLLIDLGYEKDLNW